MGRSTCGLHFPKKGTVGVAVGEIMSDLEKLKQGESPEGFIFQKKPQVGPRVGTISPKKPQVGPRVGTISQKKP